ncbi:MAG: hypothetical protein JXK93_05325 [Sphaerochaetaceae bacterium]|nr:hypothetical protein [Sphaerochaetaceae bacterium]
MIIVMRSAGECGDLPSASFDVFFGCCGKPLEGICDGMTTIAAEEDDVCRRFSPFSYQSCPDAQM